MSDRPIVVEYDPTWPGEFQALAVVLAQALGDLARGIHHNGQHIHSRHAGQADPGY